MSTLNLAQDNSRCDRFECSASGSGVRGVLELGAGADSIPRVRCMGVGICRGISRVCRKREDGNAQHEHALVLPQRSGCGGCLRPNPAGKKIPKRFPAGHRGGYISPVALESAISKQRCLTPLDVITAGPLNFGGRRGPLEI